VTSIPEGWKLVPVSAGIALAALSAPAGAEVGRVQELAPDVYFYEGDGDKGHCNNGWIVFEDYVLVIDANLPSGAKLVIEEIRKITQKPVRFAFDTHHHGDHVYGNQVWVNQGATPVASTGVIAELDKYEPGRYVQMAQNFPELKATKLKRPSLLFPDTMIFDDGNHRVELHFFGTAHTHGDGFAWLPEEKILFSGDAVVNGPHNYVGDGDTGQWIETLQPVMELGARIVAPGHGAVGEGSLVADQQLFFRELRRVVESVSEGASAAEVQSAIDEMREQLLRNPAVAKYVGESFPAQVAKVYNELTGKSFPDRRSELEAERKHLASHGIEEGHTQREGYR
jgi:glyoxylase-like metal-dependent hydrolase (beta-lactamase superfamily II)